MVKRVFVSGTKRFENAIRMARAFNRDEDGGVFTIFVVLGFVLILATAGIGVDIMNFERDRTSLQGTLDRAVLAAANVKQTLPPKEVVISYIEKSDVRGKLTEEPDVFDNPTIGSRKVTAKAKVDVNTHFMWFFGYPTLTASVTSVAEESIGSLEIALVLDISGSMGRASATPGKTKMKALQEAAIQFVNTIYLGEDPDKISISIVPYNNQVNAGANILDHMPGVTTEHSYSHCVDFADTDVEDQFKEPGIDPNKTLNRTAHFDPFGKGDRYDREAHTSSVCTTRVGSSITPLTNIVSDLHDQINAMTAGGNTSIDIGVKWGAALLDPQFQPVIRKLSNQNANASLVIDPTTGLDADGNEPKKVVPAAFGNRPLLYESNVKKIMIVMTDGQNTSNWVLDENLRDGLSDVWYNPNTSYEKNYWNCREYYDWDAGLWIKYNCGGRLRRSGEYSVQISENPPEYLYTRRGTRGHSEPFNEEGESVRLTYPELWNRVNLDWNAEYNYAFLFQRTRDWYNNAFTTIGSGTKNTRVNDICGAIKAKNVDVYGIAFEAPEAGATVIKNCSSGDGFYFKVNEGGTLGDNNLSLSQVFDVIAVSIKQLRLTQ
ncbi:TadE/TadG family type IV pilus assembly protein [Ruegeria halocynthiae]|uniref:TadE/TadG family type IV pilus assembly protein n=1 Tax=Ruegeria halocynthiae TaxID=985054 RepID=UPI00055FAA38|nr:TadE/TadG family type IV pilus assembly protein [Ruegeria halocynthiae]